MALRRVFVDEIVGGAASVEGERAHHLHRVARLRPGERVEISDQTRLFAAVTESCSTDRVRFSLAEQLPTPAQGRPVDVALSIFKYSRFEWAIEKLTELGVRRILPIVAARTDPGLAGAAPKRTERRQRIVFEAAQQSRRLAAPIVEPPQTFDQAVRGPREGEAILLDFGAAGLSGVVERHGALTIFVGPEGGWSEQERALAASHGLRTAGLGERVLRAETAAVAAAAFCTLFAAENADSRA